MINPKEHYQELGRMAAQALNHNDRARYEFEKNYFTRCKRIEKEEDRMEAAQAFDEGFAEVRHVPKPEYFK